jgi:Beta-propeller repeat
MRHWFLLALVWMSVSDLSRGQVPTEHPSNVSPVFIENMGQFDPKVKFQVKIGTQTAWLTHGGVVFDATRQTRAGTQTMERVAFSENFIGASGCLKAEGKDPRPGVYNYFQSGDPKEWRTQVRGYAEVVCRDVWPGIDLRIHSNGPDLEQEFTVKPGGDTSLVQIGYQGIDRIRIAEDGSLEITTLLGTLRETKPRLYQEIGGKQIAVDGLFKITGESSYAFKVGPHASQYALVIDPTILYSTFLGGSAGNNGYSSNDEVATGVGVDSSGNAYVSGYTLSSDFPTTVGALQTSSGGSYVAFVTKLNASGSALLYSTYLGHGGQADAIAVDATGNAYVTGYASQLFPTTANAFWPTNPQQHCTDDYFVAKLNPTGNQLLYSSCFNVGFDAAYGALYGVSPKSIAIDNGGKAYVAGFASGSGAIPTTSNAYQAFYNGMKDSAFVIVFDTTASGTASLYYSTYLAVPPALNQPFLWGNMYVSRTSTASGIAVDSFGKIYVTGSSWDGFPTTAGSFQPAHGGCGGNGIPCVNAFIAKLDPAAPTGPLSLIYSTYLGGTNDSEGNAITVDASGSAYVTGSTWASANFPVTSGAFQTALDLGLSAFVAKLNAGGSQLAYSTHLNGTSGDSVGHGIAVDLLGNAYIAGNTNSATFPVTLDAFQRTYIKQGGSNAFLTKLNPTGSALLYSSYLGGMQDDGATSVAVDPAGDVYIAGHTSSAGFPVTNFAFQPSMHGTGDAFVTKFPLGSNSILSVSSLTPTSGGNAGSVSPQIFGTGLHSGATASLNCGGSTFTGTNLSVGPGGRFLNTTFTLAGAIPGVCDVVVTNPDSTSVTLLQAFTIQQGGAPNIQVHLTGVVARTAPGEVAVAPANALVIATVSNTGTVDSTGGFVVEPLNPFSPTSVNPSAIANSATLAANQQVVWNTPSIPAGQSQAFTSTATWPSSSSNSTLIAQACFSPYTGVDYTKFLICMKNNLALNVGTCGGAALVCGTAAPTVLGAGFCITAALACGGTIGPQINNCFNSSLIHSANPICIQAPLLEVQPMDPNSLVGSPGVGGQRWVPGAQTLAYAISFENEPTATAPAQQVIVAQSLGANVNLGTLTLLGITIPNGAANVQVYVPSTSFDPTAGVNEFTTNVDLRPNQNLLVNVDAKLNPATQTLTWTLTSIDSATGSPPLNPLVGFLPAGAGANASFSVMPTPGLVTGTQVAEQASVVFDGQAAMSTAVWANTIDNAAPVSHVSALPNASTCSAFRVSWSGSDVGSGLQGFTVYVSDTGGPFTPWLSNTTSVGATFTGAVGHSYAFYSIVGDLAGNLEGAKTSPEASIAVTGSSSCGPPSLSGQVLNSSRSGTALTVVLQLTNTGFTDALAVNVNAVTFRTLSGSGVVTLASPALPATLGPLAVGASMTATFTLDVPSTVARFSLIEGGNVLDAVSRSYNYSIAQTIAP